MAYDGMTLTISDLASRNGVKINGAKVATSELKHGDLIGLGEIVLRVEWPTHQSAVHEPEEWQKPTTDSSIAKKVAAALLAIVLFAILGVLLTMAFLDKAKTDQSSKTSGPILSTTLHAAAASGKLDAIKEHVKAGRNINAKNEFGFTPLHSAVSNDRLQAIKLLLELGADPTIRSNDGITPLDLAKIRANSEIVKILSEWKPKGQMK
jgi:pSer/pThr/pTyr-binding forkhead associated (FHA) protein